MVGGVWLGGRWNFIILVPASRAGVDLLPTTQWRTLPRLSASIFSLAASPRGGINTWGNTALLFTCCSWDFIGQVGGGIPKTAEESAAESTRFQEWHRNIVPLRLCHRSSWEKQCGDSKDHSHSSRNHYFSIFHKHNIPLNITLRRQVTHFHFSSHTNGIKNSTYKTNAIRNCSRCTYGFWFFFYSAHFWFTTSPWWSSKIFDRVVMELMFDLINVWLMRD